MPTEGPYKMKGSPHKLGTIEGTSAFRAKKKFAVEQTRTSSDAALVGAASELGSSYVPGTIDYSVKTGFETKSKEKKKNGKKKDKKKDKDTRGWGIEMDPNQLKDRPIVTDKPDKGKKDIKIEKKDIDWTKKY